MRSLLLILCCTLFLPLALCAQSGEYEVVEVDVQGNTFTGKLNAQLRTFRVRPSVELTINGIKDNFSALEPGMKVKVTSAEPGLATRLAATGIRTRTARESNRPMVGTALQPSRQVEATIAASDPDGFPIGDIRKGTKISVEYKGGMWKHHGRIAHLNPDDENMGYEKSRLVVALPRAGGKLGEVLAIVSSNTKKRPFVFEADKDYSGLVLRINHEPSTNPGKVRYNVRILPPTR